MPADLLYGPWPSKVVPLPRSSFGLRKSEEPTTMRAILDSCLVRPEDLDAQERVKTLAREARAALGDDGHVHPSMKRDLAAKIAGAAQFLESLIPEARLCGLLTTMTALREHAGLLEKESALVSAVLGDHE